jgi:CRP-like cAMP-binding protein
MKSVLDIAGYIANKYDARLQPEELQQFASIMDVRELKKGEMFLNQGQIAKDILYVRSDAIVLLQKRTRHNGTFRLCGHSLCLQYYQPVSKTADGTPD